MRLEQLPVAGDEPRLDQRGADRHVGARLLQAFLHRARGVADLLLEVPEHVEQRFDDLLDRSRRLVRKQEQEVDVGAGGEHAAPVSPDRDDRRRGLALERGEPADRELQRDAQEIVDLSAQRLRAGPPGPAGLQRLARLRATFSRAS